MSLSEPLELKTSPEEQKTVSDCVRDLKQLGLSDEQIQSLSDNIRAVINRTYDELQNSDQ